MTELVIAAYAAETGSHLVGAPRDRRFRAFARSFDERAYLQRLDPLGVRWLPRTDPGFPGGLAVDAARHPAHHHQAGGRKVAA